MGHEVEDTPEATGNERQALSSQSNGTSEEGMTEASEEVTDASIPAEAVVERVDDCSAGEDQPEAEMKKELAPTAPAWTPESTEKTDNAQEQASHPESSPAAVPPGDR